MSCRAAAPTTAWSTSPAPPNSSDQLIDVDITSAMSHTLRGEPRGRNSYPEVLARAAAERHAQVGLDAREVVRPRAA